MNLKEALEWVEKNCKPEAVQRLRSRRVAITLANEIDFLNRYIVQLECAVKNMTSNVK